MSDNEPRQSEVAKPCPVCDGAMEAIETICANCRAELEKATMAVRAEDYPPPARVLSPGNALLDRESGVGSPIESQLDTAIADDMDLLPLAPIGDSVRSAVAARPARAPASESLASNATTRGMRRPAPAPTPVEMDIPAEALRPKSTWRIALITILVTIAAGVLAAVIWSMVVPARATEPETPPAAVQ